MLRMRISFQEPGRIETCERLIPTRIQPHPPAVRLVIEHSHVAGSCWGLLRVRSLRRLPPLANNLERYGESDFWAEGRNPARLH